MYEDRVLERDELAIEDFGSPQSVPAWHEPSVKSDKPELTARAPSPHESPVAKELPSLLQLETAQPQVTGKGHRASCLRRRLVVSAIGAMLLVSALGGGYVYLDYAKHFQSTDDAFIAARQTALAPKVSGYITAVPVTDNEHVATGDVIARIDDRDYRIALEQAEAQVAAAQASIENSTRNSMCSKHRSAPTRRRWIRLKRRWCSRSSRRHATSIWSRQAMAAFRMLNNTPRNCISSRRRWRAHKRR
jgi:membrane fusion protein (multidrug efflux system)